MLEGFKESARLNFVKGPLADIEVIFPYRSQADIHLIKERAPSAERKLMQIR